MCPLLMAAMLGGMMARYQAPVERPSGAVLDCPREGCAWWDEAHAECHIITAAIALERLSQKMGER